MVGTGAYFSNDELVMGTSNITLTAQWKINQYDVTCIDKAENIDGITLGTSTWKADYNSKVSGSQEGDLKEWDVYYLGYKYDSCTEIIVDTENNVVYRIFLPTTIDISGAITWDDKNDKLGYRPEYIEIILYRNGIQLDSKTIFINNTNNEYSYLFDELATYDENKTKYVYTVEQKFTSKFLTWDSNLKEMKEIDAYSIYQNQYDFNNILNTLNGSPIIEVKPNHTNTLNMKLSFNENIEWDYLESTEENISSLIKLKQLESIIVNNEVIYTQNYSGVDYNTIVNKNGVTMSNIPSGKYEIIVTGNINFDVENIVLNNGDKMKIEVSDDKYFLIIESTNTDNSGDIAIILNSDDNKKYNNENKIINKYKIY